MPRSTPCCVRPSTSMHRARVRRVPRRAMPVTTPSSCVPAKAEDARLLISGPCVNAVAVDMAMGWACSGAPDTSHTGIHRRSSHHSRPPPLPGEPVTPPSSFLHAPRARSAGSSSATAPYRRVVDTTAAETESR